MLTYEDFLERKRTKDIPSGFDITLPLNPYLKDFQAAIVRWGIKRGRAAIFAGCGLGKTLMQLEWARHIQEKTGQNVLIIAPLAVSRQTVHEGEKFGIPVVRLSEKIPPAPISIINYEQLHKYRPDDWGGVVLDESSILKSIDGKHRTALIEEWSQIPYRLACTATPAPNDYTELGNHSEFLGIMTRVEMLATFFTHDGGNTSQWRLKKHGEDEYWKWVAGWAMWMQKPSDLGFSDEGYELPPLHFHEIRVSGKKTSDTLFPMEAKSLRERQKARRASIAARMQKCAEKGQFLAQSTRRFRFFQEHT